MHSRDETKRNSLEGRINVCVQSKFKWITVPCMGSHSTDDRIGSEFKWRRCRQMKLLKKKEKRKMGREGIIWWSSEQFLSSELQWTTKKNLKADRRSYCWSMFCDFGETFLLHNFTFTTIKAQHAPRMFAYNELCIKFLLWKWNFKPNKKKHDDDNHATSANE